MNLYDLFQKLELHGEADDEVRVYIDSYVYSIEDVRRDGDVVLIETELQ